MIAVTVLLAGLAAAAVAVALTRRPAAAPLSEGAAVYSRIPGPSAADEGYPTFETLEPAPPHAVSPASPPPPPASARTAPRRRARAPGRPVTPAPQSGRDSALAPDGRGPFPRPGTAPGSKVGGSEASPGSLGQSGGPKTGTVPASDSGAPIPGPETPAVPAVEAPRPSPSPVLTPPVPLEQPQLHPVLRATVLPGPGGLAAADEASVRGRVRVRLLVRADGTVARVDIVVSSGDSSLDEAARQGLLRWHFAPARRDGVPIDAYLLVWVTFAE